MSIKLDPLDNIYYENGAYNSDKFFELHFIQQYTYVPGLFSGVRKMEFSVPSGNDFFMLLSTGDILLENSTGAYNLKDFDFMLWQPHKMQYITMQPKPKTSFFVSIFSGTQCGELLQNLDLELNTVYSLITNENLPNFTKQIGYISHELKEHKKYCKTMASAMYWELLATMSRHRVTPVEIPNADAINQSIKYIISNVDKKIDLARLIRDCGMSRSTFYALFKEQTGMSPLQYINDTRLSKAADYMTLLKYSVTEAAMVVGFDDPLYFGRLFKRKFGMSPTEYKKKHSNVDRL